MSRLAWLVLVVPLPALAGTWTVNTTLDEPDSNPGDGTCATASNTCSLRAALEEGLEEDGSVTIEFDLQIGGDDFSAQPFPNWVIRLQNDLPVFDANRSLTLDGTTQMGWLAAQPNIAVLGQGYEGLAFEATGQPATLTVTGLAFSGFDGPAIRYEHAGAADFNPISFSLTHCFLGTDVAGTEALGGGSVSVSATPPNRIGSVRIGSVDLSQGGNVFVDSDLYLGGVQRAWVQGNQFGVPLDGSTPIGGSTTATFYQVTPGAGVVTKPDLEIDRNTFGVLRVEEGSGAQIHDNTIGTTTDGKVALPTLGGLDAIRTSDVSIHDNLIAGTVRLNYSDASIGGAIAFARNTVGFDANGLWIGGGTLQAGRPGLTLLDNRLMRVEAGTMSDPSGGTFEDNIVGMDQAGLFVQNQDAPEPAVVLAGDWVARRNTIAGGLDLSWGEVEVHGNVIGPDPLDLGLPEGHRYDGDGMTLFEVTGFAQDNRVQYFEGDGVRLGSTEFLLGGNVPTDPNTILHNGGAGVRLTVGHFGVPSAGVTIEKNEIAHNGESGVAADAQGNGGPLITGLTLRDNELYGNGGYAVLLDPIAQMFEPADTFGYYRNGDGVLPEPGTCGRHATLNNAGMAPPEIQSVISGGGSVTVTGSSCPGARITLYQAEPGDAGRDAFPRSGPLASLPTPAEETFGDRGAVHAWPHTFYPLAWDASTARLHEITTTFETAGSLAHGEPSVPVGHSIAAANGTFTVGGPVPAGTAFTLMATDPAGNSSHPSRNCVAGPRQPITVSWNTSAPVGGRTLPPMLRGSADPGEVVSLALKNQHDWATAEYHPLGWAIADGSGNWSWHADRWDPVDLREAIDRSQNGGAESQDWDLVRADRCTAAELTAFHDEVPFWPTGGIGLPDGQYILEVARLECDGQISKHEVLFTAQALVKVTEPADGAALTALPANVCGTTSANTPVSVTVGTETFTTTSDADGRWCVTPVSPPTAGTVTITASVTDSVQPYPCDDSLVFTDQHGTITTTALLSACGAAGDRDEDGVCDDVDPCPLDNPDDSDGDGVCDGQDECPGTDDADGCERSDDPISEGCSCDGTQGGTVWLGVLALAFARRRR